MAFKAFRCGIVSKTIVYPFIAPVFCFFDSFATFYLHPKWKKHTSLILFFLFFGQFILGVILQLFSLYANRENDRPKLKEKKQTYSFLAVKRISTPDYSHLGLGNYFLMLIPSFLYAFSLFLLNYNGSLFSFQITKTVAVVIQILFASLLCWLVLSYRYFRHNFVSYCLILLGVAICTGSDYNSFLGIRPTHLGLNLFLFFLAFCLFSCAETFDKWLMDTRFITPPKLLLIEGLTGVIIYLTLIGIFSTARCEGLWLEWSFCDAYYQGDQIESFSNFKALLYEFDLLYFMMVMVGSSLFHLCSKFTNFHYSPTHRTVSDLLSCLLGVLFLEIPSIQADSIGNKIGYVVGFVIIIMGALVYNEFILVSVLGLDENTKEMIELRVDMELIGEIIHENPKSIDEIDDT